MPRSIRTAPVAAAWSASADVLARPGSKCSRSALVSGTSTKISGTSASTPSSAISAVSSSLGTRRVSSAPPDKTSSRPALLRSAPAAGAAVGGASPVGPPPDRLRRPRATRPAAEGGLAMTIRSDPDFEPHHASSSAARVIDALQLFGYRPHRDEPDPRPLPEEHRVQSALADVFDALVSALSDTRLEPDLDELLWSTVNFFHASPKRVQRELDRNKDEQSPSQKEQDGSEIRSAELERMIGERRPWPSGAASWSSFATTRSRCSRPMPGPHGARTPARGAITAPSLQR